MKNSNPFIRQQIENMLRMVSAFRDSCDTASRLDDGRTDNDEKATLKQIDKACDKFTDALEKLL